MMGIRINAKLRKTARKHALLCILLFACLALSSSDAATEVPFLKQWPDGYVAGNMNCGPACCVMVSAALRCKTPNVVDLKGTLDFLKGDHRQYQGKLEGYWHTDLVSALSGYFGFSDAGWARGKGLEVLKPYLDKGIPIIVNVSQVFDPNKPYHRYSLTDHWIVVEGYDRDSVQIVDPGRSLEANGRGPYTINEFNAIFQGTFVYPMTTTDVPEPDTPQPNPESPNEDSVHPEVVVLGKYGFAWEKKPLNWLVLAREGERVLLITEMVIDHVPFHNTSIPVYWRDSNLREWLNNKFISDTFSTNEQEYILMTPNNTEVSSQQNHDAGILTQDRLFLLSISEVEQYFPDEEDRVAIASEHSDRRLYGVDQLNGGSSSWLLRSPGITSDRVAFVASSGLYDQRGWLMFREDYFSENSPIAPTPIRPAVWVRSDAPFLR